MKKNKKHQDSFSFKEKYQRCWKYLIKSKKFIFITAGIFLLFVFLGFFIPAPDFVSEWISDYIKGVVDVTKNLSAGGLVSFIFLKNLKSSFFGLLLGSILGIFPLFASLFNGYLLGFVLNASIDAQGVGVIWRLFPHGVFEMPAIFISLGMGLKLGIDLIFRRKKGEIAGNFYSSLEVFLLIVMPLLLLAAVIEGLLIFLT